MTATAPALPATAASVSGATSSWLRRMDTTGWLLILPAVAFLIYAFVVPIAAFLFQVVDNRTPHAQLRDVAVALGQWDGRGVPGDVAFKAVGDDLRRLVRDDAVVSLAGRLNHNKAGLRSLITRTAARLPAAEPPSWRQTLTAIDARWNDPETWRILASESGSVTWSYLLAALDLHRGADGGLANVAEDQRIYRSLFLQTVVISAVVTLLCLVIGLPIAYVLAHGSMRLQNILLVFVLLPFWSSLLVRSAGWIVVLHEQGLLNYALSWVGFGERATSMLYNRPGVYLAMTHVLLPFMILPIYSVMRGIPDTHLKAAASLGAPPWLAFRRAYLPQILPGVVAGSTLVFVSALGYYITPLLVGGPRDQMISYFIAYYTNVSVNWGMGGALSLILLASVIVIYAVIGRLIGFDRIRSG